MKDKEKGGRFPADTRIEPICGLNKLTKAEASIYLYAYSISKWNSQNREDHNYIYKNAKPTNIEIAKQLGLSREYVGKCWNNLINKGFMYYDEKNKVYIIPDLAEMIKVPQAKVKGFITYGRAHKGILTIFRLYNLLKYAFLNHPEDFFSITDFLKIFDYDQKCRQEIIDCLYCLHAGNFLFIEREKRINKFGNKYFVYRCTDLLIDEEETYSIDMNSTESALTEEQIGEYKEIVKQTAPMD